MPALHPEIIKDYPFRMLPVAGGTFRMGDEYGDLWAACRPVHEVTVAGFHLAEFPVTQALWKAVMNGETPARFQGDDERPVERVSWEDVDQQFLPALRRLTGLAYRLPTEAEWEYAARGGKHHAEGYRYAGSDRLKDVGWFGENSGGETHPVGRKYANQLGLHDMSGNVWEWCADWFDEQYYEKCAQAGITEHPAGPGKGSRRVCRGGGWRGDPLVCRVAYRYHYEPDYRGDFIGFRLALSLQSVEPVPAFR